MLESKQKQFLKSNKRDLFYCLSYADTFWGHRVQCQSKVFIQCMFRVQRLEDGCLDEVHGAILSVRFCYIYDFLDK